MFLRWETQHDDPSSLEAILLVQNPKSETRYICIHGSEYPNGKVGFEILEAINNIFKEF